MTKARESCDRFESLVSTWLDRELERPGAEEMLDHLVRCAGCRRFYRQARALSGLVVASAFSPANIEVDPGLWRRIERKSGLRSPRQVSGWAVRVAALLVVAAGLTTAVWRSRDAGVASSLPSEVQVELERNREAMTEGRFLELTTELLESDRRYHLAMYEVMGQVVRDTRDGEGTGDENLRHRNGVESSERTQGPA
jgi:predicted anti-sigma-YlaC factor YlaD